MARSSRTDPPRAGAGVPSSTIASLGGGRAWLAAISKARIARGEGRALPSREQVDLAGRQVQGPAVGPAPGDHDVQSAGSRTSASGRRRSGPRTWARAVPRGEVVVHRHQRLADPAADHEAVGHAEDRVDLLQDLAVDHRPGQDLGAGSRRASRRGASPGGCRAGASGRRGRSRTGAGRSGGPRRTGTGSRPARRPPASPGGRAARRGRAPGRPGGAKSTRKSPSLTGPPRRHSRNWTCARLVDRDGEDPGPRPRPAGPRRRSRARPRSGGGSGPPRRGAAPGRPPGPAPGPGSGRASGRSPPRAGPGPRGRPERVEQPARACRSSRPAGPGFRRAASLPRARAEAARACRTRPQVRTPWSISRTSSSVDRGVRLLAVEVEQLVLGEPAEELEVVDGELAGEDLLGPAPGRHVGIAPAGQGPVGQPPGGQGQGGRRAARPSARRRPAARGPRAPRGPLPASSA